MLTEFKTIVIRFKSSIILAGFFGIFTFISSISGFSESLNDYILPIIKTIFNYSYGLLVLTFILLFSYIYQYQKIRKLKKTITEQDERIKNIISYVKISLNYKGNDNQLDNRIHSILEEMQRKLLEDNKNYRIGFVRPKQDKTFTVPILKPKVPTDGEILSKTYKWGENINDIDCFFGYGMLYETCDVYDVDGAHFLDKAKKEEIKKNSKRSKVHLIIPLIVENHSSIDKIVSNRLGILSIGSKSFDLKIKEGTKEHVIELIQELINELECLLILQL